MAKNPDPLLPLTSYNGGTRTLDDWATIFNIAVIVVPDRPEGAAFVPVIDRIFATLGDSDVRTIVCVPSTKAITKRILDLHGSTISVSSEPGRTVFRFTLAYAPLTGPADSRTSQIEPAAARRVPSLAYPMADPSA